MKTPLPEMKNALDGINARLDPEKEKINKIEDITMETIQNESHREKII